MNDDDDPDDLRDPKRTRDKESKKTQKQRKRDQDKNKNEYCNEDEKNERTGSTTGEAHGITMIGRPSLNKRAITNKAQHSLGGKRWSSFQKGELMEASNGTMKNRNIRRFYPTENVSAFSEITTSPWNRAFQDLFSWIFQSPVNRESILIIEDVVRRGCRLSLVMITLNYTNAQICFSTLQEEFTAGDERLDLIQAAGDNSHGLLGRSFRNFQSAGSILIIGDATRRRRLILATTPLSYLNDSRILIFVSQEAFSPEGVSLNLIQAAEDNASRAVIVRIQPGALIPLQVLRIRCRTYSMPHDSDGKQSQGALRPLRSRERPRDLSDLKPRSPSSVLASPVNVQTNMAASTTRAKEWSCAIPGRSDSACGSAPYPQCKMKAKGPSSELSTSKGSRTHSANLRFERNKDLVNMDAALQAPRQRVHGSRVTVTKRDDEMFVSGTIAVHYERSPRTHTLLKYPTQCTDTEVTYDRNGRYESACQAESEDDGIQGESYRQPVMKQVGKQDGSRTTFVKMRVIRK